MLLRVQIQMSELVVVMDCTISGQHSRCSTKFRWVAGGFEPTVNENSAQDRDFAPTLQPYSVTVR